MNAEQAGRQRAGPAKPRRTPQGWGGGVAAKKFPIVGIGASAGGLETYSEMLRYTPTDTGMAFVLVQHLDPKHASILAELLHKTTRMPVREAADGLKVEPDHVYVIPPNSNLAILHGALHLIPRVEKTGQHMPIDYFFRSLAQDQGSQAIGVVLSGTASDGAQGLRAIKSEGGITFSQDPETAKYDGMPRAAIAAGVDFILPPRGIAEELARISRHPYITRPIAPKAAPEVEGDFLQKIFILLRSITGADFTYYKHSTIKRRIARRMVLYKLERLDQYLKHLQENPNEVEALYEDLLITVTSFFREPEAFAVLKKQVFPKLVEGRSADAAIRIWVPGCSTGEEVYSIVIALMEFLNGAAVKPPIQVFGTDINEAAVEKARHGVYPENIAADVSGPRLRRFFTQIEGGYQVNKIIRDACIFAKHDVTKDPPLFPA